MRFPRITKRLWIFASVVVVLYCAGYVWARSERILVHAVGYAGSRDDRTYFHSVVLRDTGIGLPSDVEIFSCIVFIPLGWLEGAVWNIIPRQYEFRDIDPWVH